MNPDPVAGIVRWYRLGDVDEPDRVAVDRDTGELYVDLELGGDPATLASEAARRELPVLHRDGQRYAPASWLKLRCPSAAARIEWIAAQIAQRQAGKSKQEARW